MGRSVQARLFFGYYEQGGSENTDWGRLEASETGIDANALEAVRQRLGVESQYTGNYGRRALYIERTYITTIGAPVDLVRMASETCADEWERLLREYGRMIGMRFGHRKPRWWLVPSGS